MRLINTLLLLALAVPLTAQEEEIRRANLPSQLEWELLRMYDGGAERYDGPVVIERQQVIRGAVAAMGGPLRVAGRIEGDVAMVDGDVIVEPGGSITGDVTVIGGEVRLQENASVAGTITAYGRSTRIVERRRDRERDRDRDRDRDADWEWGDEDDDEWWDRRRRGDRWARGYSRLTVRTGSSYNRVEGLPVMFGPVIQTAGANPLRLEALGIWRSESGPSLDTDRMGYQVKAEQFLGGSRRLSVGGSAFSVVDPLDRWQVGDLEASLAAVVFHDDYRDYYDRTGWSAFARVEPARGVEARIGYRDEEHGSLVAGDPWTLFHRSDLWRYQPLMAHGDLQIVEGSLELDLRNTGKDRARGWYGRVSLERPVGGSLTRPALLTVIPAADPPVGFPGNFIPATEIDTDFTSAFVDLRRYNMIGYDSQLNLRLVAGGNMAEKPLPPQFQHALGGIGTLPGFPTFSVDCGARRAVGSRGTGQFFPSYGCDRFALAQVEYRGDLSLDFGFGDPDYDDDDWWGDIEVDLSPTWAVFFDAARGWAFEDPVLGPDRSTDVLFDAGVGFLLDNLGVYMALPLNGDVEQEPRFFLRWGRRF